MEETGREPKQRPAKWQNQLANKYTHIHAHTHTLLHISQEQEELESQEKHLVDDENHGNIN